MAGERRARILELLGRGEREPDMARLCDVCAEVTGMAGAGITLLSEGVTQGSVCSSDAVVARLAELELELGEGPGTDANDIGAPVLMPNLAVLGTRWVVFSARAVEAGAGAVFGFPLRVGAIRLGALVLYCDRRGPLTDDQHADALVAADVAAEMVLAVQSSAPPGELASELAAGGDFPNVVHQATGMIAAQLEVGVALALMRLRAHAFTTGRPLADIAGEVVARLLRFTDKDTP